MTALYVILAIAVAVVLLFCVKVGVELRYEDDFEVFLRVLGLRFRLLPLKPKKPKKPKKEKPKKEKPEKEKKEKKPKAEKPKGENILVRFYRSQGFDGTMQFLADVLAVMRTMIGDIIARVIVLDRLMLRLRVSRRDAAETALAYGKTCAAVYPALGVICTHLTVRKYDADIRADYLAEKSTASVWFIVSVRPFMMIIALMRFVFRFIIVCVKTRMRGSKRKKQLSKERNVQS